MTKYLKLSRVKKGILLLIISFFTILNTSAQKKKNGGFLGEISQGIKDIKGTVKEITGTKKEIEKITKKKEINNDNKQEKKVSIKNSKNSKFLFYNDKLFYSKGRQDYVSIDKPDYIEFTKMNVLTKDKNEEEYLLNLISFFADNKRNNFSELKCNKETIKYRVFERQTDGIPKLVNATFSYLNDSNIIELGIQFDEGIPCIWFFNKEFLSDHGYYDGVIGHLNFTRSQMSHITSFSYKAADERKVYREKYINPKVNDSLTNVIKKMFPGADCSACLTRTVESTGAETKVYGIYDEQGYKTGTEEKTTYKYNVIIRNKCKKNIKLVGISQIGNSAKKNYTVITKSFKSNYVYKIEIEQSETGFLLGSAIPFGGWDINDIDLSCINKKFDTENGPVIQYIKAVEDK